ncbi:multicopper oxidase family protein [Halomarina pelagica]|uniref:multicopper oxidase family protein n=1 Tax=Halomarina pelagica TaxID=2961599 RepID=UPI0034A524D7
MLRIAGGGVVGTLAGCTSLQPRAGPGYDDGSAPNAPPGRPDREYRLRTTPGTADVGGGGAYRTWLYNDQFPGPELRALEGERLRVTVTNGLSEGTTVHWHGIPLPNPMDGVPDVTQPAIEPDRSFEYEYQVPVSGTYFYHSHVGLQPDRGLYGPLIVEEREPHVDYDREYTLMLDDYLPDAPRPTPGGGGMGGHGGMNDPDRPEYTGLLLNGRRPSAPPIFDVRESERVRLRFVNASSATTFGVRIGGHPLSITHADGQPVEPVTVDAFEFGSGERYDAIVTADDPGTWEIQAVAIDGTERPARGILRYDTADGPPVPPERPGTVLGYEDLRSTRSLDRFSGSPDRTFDLSLSGNMMGSGAWLIDGQAYPRADPLPISEGEHVRVRLTNRSPMLHPMHLHGHFFRVGDALKDTVVVPARMGTVTFDFVADNPGDWLFHCHNLYHLEAGMARVFEYR